MFRIFDKSRHSGDIRNLVRAVGKNAPNICALSPSEFFCGRGRKIFGPALKLDWWGYQMVKKFLQ